MDRIRGTVKAAAVKARASEIAARRCSRIWPSLTGGQVISEELGIKLENVDIDMLGKARKIVITKDDTTIVDGAGKATTSRPVSTRSGQEIDRTDSDSDKEKLQERLAKLCGGVAVVKVGAATEVELKEKKRRIEDALSATRAAVEEGIVPGGGVALVRPRRRWQSAEALERRRVPVGASSWPRRWGAVALDRARTPARGIGNRGERARRGSKGFNAATGNSRTCSRPASVDPLKVTRSALQKAASIAAIVLTTEVLVVEKPEEEPPADEHGDHGHAHYRPPREPPRLQSKLLVGPLVAAAAAYTIAHAT